MSGREKPRWLHAHQACLNIAHGTVYSKLARVKQVIIDLSDE